MRTEDVVRAVALNDDGRNIRYIANVLGEAKSTVHDAISRFRQTGEYSRRQGSGRKRKTNMHDDRFMVLTALRDRGLPSSAISRQLRNIRGTYISSDTIRRRLGEQALNSRRPAACPALSPAHRTARLHFAREHINWTVEQWGRVLFTDESRFSLRSPDGRERVWRRQGERFAQCCISPRVPYGGGSIMVWAGVSSNERTELVLILNGAMTADRYINECLAEHVVPFAHYIGANNFCLMHDNATPHVARVVNEYLNEVNIQRFQWPARSPDLNPIEHVWDILGRRIRKREPAPETIPSLQIALLEEWNNISQEKIANCVQSLPRRMRDVIRARGGNTRY